jgi:hypothetical protein
LASIFNIDVLEVLLVAMKPHLSNVLEILFIIILKKKKSWVEKQLSQKKEAPRKRWPRYGVLHEERWRNTLLQLLSGGISTEYVHCSLQRINTTQGSLPFEDAFGFFGH